LAGDSQAGVPGFSLLQPIILRVVDGAGEARSGVAVGFEVAEGGGSVPSSLELSGGMGLVSTRWSLGETGMRTQRMRAYLPGEDGSASVTVEATALEADETDLVIVHNALGPLRGVLVVGDDEQGVLEILQERAAADTVVPLQPMGAGEWDILVFPQANAPLRATVGWTEGVDTVHLDLSPPVELAVRFNVHEGPFEERKAIIEEHMAQAQGVWDREGMGIRFGDVTFVDLTEGDPEVNVDAIGRCDFSTQRAELEVNYVHLLNGGYIQGHACGRLVYMGWESYRWPLLLAHELGHVLSLPHSQVGLMTSGVPGAILSDGEVFMAQFNRESVVNWLFGFHPQAHQRLCIPFVGASPCLPMDYHLPG
jgi:hypothetical protein